MVRAAICLLALALAAANAAYTVKVNNKWVGGKSLCGSFDLRVKCPATCPLGCELDITDAGLARSTFQLREDDDVIGRTPVYTNPTIAPAEGVDARSDFPAFSETQGEGEDYSAAAFHLSHGTHTIEVVGTSMLSKKSELLSEPEIAAKSACAYVRATCFAQEAPLAKAPRKAAMSEEVLSIAGLREDRALTSRRGLYATTQGQCSDVSPVTFISPTYLGDNVVANADECCVNCIGYSAGAGCQGFTYYFNGSCFLWTALDGTVADTTGTLLSAYSVFFAADGKTPLFPDHNAHGTASTPSSVHWSATPHTVITLSDPNPALTANQCQFFALGYTSGPGTTAWDFDENTTTCYLYANGGAAVNPWPAGFVGGTIVRPST